MSSWSDMASGSDRLSFLTSREEIGFSPSHPLRAACDHQGLFQGLFHANGDSGGSTLDGSPDKLGVIEMPRQPHGGRTGLGDWVRTWLWLPPPTWKALPSLHLIWEVEVGTRLSTSCVKRETELLPI